MTNLGPTTRALCLAAAALTACGFAWGQSGTGSMPGAQDAPLSGDKPTPPSSAAPMASAPAGTVGTALSDTAITTKVKAAFAGDKTVSATTIHVTTKKGEVQLSGAAKSAAEKQRAEDIARTTDGVRNVRNAITVKP